MTDKDGGRKDGGHDNEGTRCACCAGRLSMAEYRRMIDDRIARDGFVLTGIFDADPPFAYTIGFFPKYGFEVIITGTFGPEDYNSFITTIASALDDDPHVFDAVLADPPRESPNAAHPAPHHDIMGIIKVRIHGGEPVDVAVGVKEVHPVFKAEMMAQSTSRYGPNIRALQIFIPDPHGKLPWHDGFSDAWGAIVRMIDLSMRGADEKED
jgi:hypothetical protein